MADSLKQNAVFINELSSPDTASSVPQALTQLQDLVSWSWAGDESVIVSPKEGGRARTESGKRGVVFNRIDDHHGR